jgi:hypothetical protein
VSSDFCKAALARGNNGRQRIIALQGFSKGANLRYSLDRIRSWLRPYYEAMKNQTTKPNTLSDSSARLIKPLESKRVPSVVPGLASHEEPHQVFAK